MRNRSIFAHPPMRAPWSPRLPAGVRKRVSPHKRAFSCAAWSGFSSLHQKEEKTATTKARKRDNNEGSIRKRPDGRWEARLVVGYNVDGSPQRRSLYAAKKKGVQQKMKDALEAVENDEYVEPQKLTIGDWLDEWWRTYCIPFKKQSTCTGYESTIV